MEVVLFYLPITIDLDEHLAAELLCGVDRPLRLEWTVVNSLSLGICFFLLADRLLASI